MEWEEGVDDADGSAEDRSLAGAACPMDLNF